MLPFFLNSLSVKLICDLKQEYYICPFFGLCMIFKFSGEIEYPKKKTAVSKLTVFQTECYLKIDISSFSIMDVILANIL